MNYASNRAWSDRFIPEIRRLVGPLLLEPSSFKVDTTQATDLVVLKGRDMAIAARVRKPGYAKRYPHDFTIRSEVRWAAQTELHKLLDGWGDWLFYGHSSYDEVTFDRWFIIDLHVWRRVLLVQGQKRAWGGLAREIDNRDGTKGIAFDVRDFPGALIDSSEEIYGESAA